MHFQLSNNIRLCLRTSACLCICVFVSPFKNKRKMSSPSPLISLTLLSLCVVIILSLPLSNNYQLSTSRHLPLRLSNRVNREKRSYQLEERIRLPTGRIAEIRKKHEVVKGDSSNVDNNGVDGDDELIDQLDVRQPILPYTADIGNSENELTMLTNDQRQIALPFIELPEDDVYETDGEIEEVPKYVLIPAEEMITVPTSMVEEGLIPIDEDALNDLELRGRIAVLANALNERATRGL
ncbi:Uncharacterized protein BM_BM12849 [Brugia malayi]|uniref:Bm12849, isoform a n=1 Tax=Brugia malayi TaxID=6279 RepID=A0A0J9Y4F5_BRUMA|nr:Uncharacterized protein BM_BM12849 [Brugia malayi]CDQ02155.1 Bm12849, isoform a [Brugia malayi]VIO96234.1 Uncharacterized protein BM_BM12849 [Brugia malayi]